MSTYASNNPVNTFAVRVSQDIRALTETFNASAGQRIKAMANNPTANKFALQELVKLQKDYFNYLKGSVSFDNGFDVNITEAWGMDMKAVDKIGRVFDSVAS